MIIMEFWNNRGYSDLTHHYSYSCLFRRCRGIVVDGIFELMWINVHFESIWVFLMMRCFRKLRKCCWCKIWGFWIWNESILTLPASPLLCLSSPLAKTSEELLIKFLNKCLKNVNFNKLRSNEFEESIINIRKLVIHQVFLYALILAVHPSRITHLLSPIKFELLNDILG